MTTIIFIFFLILNILFVLFIKKLSIIINLYDEPDNERKLHHGKIPILGGIIFLANILALSIFYILNNQFYFFELPFNLINNFFSFFTIFFLIFLIGFYDDKFNIDPLKKLYFLAFIIFLAILIDSELRINVLRFSFNEQELKLGYLSLLITVLCFLLFLNAFNMYDGINLQSISFLLILFFTLFFIEKNYFVYSILILVSLTVGYLNYKSYIFLGDSGSLSVSYLIGYLLIKNYNNFNIESADTIFLFLIIPGLDMLRLFILRILEGRSPFSADRNHLHHLFIDKFNYKLSIGFIMLMTMMPFFLYLITDYEILSIITSIIVYIFVCLILQKYRLNNKIDKSINER